ncbi:MAG: beta-lactamase family protein [Sphingobacteriaceae bacterium]|nr:beta-lactamase family protein [Sphingobacteriaceae bacterium]
MKLLLSILIIALTACQQNTKNNQSASSKSCTSDSLLSKVDSYLNSYVDSGFAGVALIADKNGIIFHKAYNGKGDNIDTSTAFGIASSAKCLTSTAIMQLHERGKLSINDLITKYFDNVPSDKKSITIRYLLTHTSGLDECNCIDGETEPLKLINGILHSQIAGSIGGKWLYRNENYYLLDYIIEKVSKMSYRNYVQQNILNAAEMHHTGQSAQEKEKSVILAAIELDSLKKQPVYAKSYVNGALKTNLASHKVGAYFSTSNDMYKWALAVRNNKLISDSTLVLSLQPQTSGLIRDKDTALYYGYGWVFTTVKGKRINFFMAGREDWMWNNRAYILENGFTIIVWSRDKKGPDSDAMATVLTKELVKIFEKIN